MNINRLVTINTILMFGLLSFMLGHRIALLDAWGETGDWVSRANRMDDVPDRIPATDIKGKKGEVCIRGNFSLSQYNDTDSMLPVLDYGANGIQIKVTETTPIYIGDIVSYEVDDYNGTIVHRVINIKEDNKGIYYVTKGDNLRFADPFRVRRENILRITVGVIW